MTDAARLLAGQERILRQQQELREQAEKYSRDTAHWAAEISRLIQELEAAEAKGREARDKALEEAALIADRAWASRSHEYALSGERDFRGAADEARDIGIAVRALKSNPKSKDTQGGT